MSNSAIMGLSCVAVNKYYSRQMRRCICFQPADEGGHDRCSAEHMRNGLCVDNLLTDREMID